MEAEQLEIDWTRKAWKTPSYLQRLSVRERPHARPVMRQRWSSLLFLHWPVSPAVLQARLPRGLHVDTFDGKAWIGVVPFAMQRVHPVGLPPLPWISWFLELNVRTYVHDENGRPGVWFFSLDCNQPLAVEVARRFFHLPYNHAKMSSEFRSGRIVYTSRRQGASELSRFRYRPPVQAAPAADGSLEWFLVERYLLFTTDAEGQIRCGRVHHTPYRIENADCAEWSALPIMENGFAEPEERPASALVAEPVDVTIFPLEKIR
jgi:uncharacterized protein YqjF (DUF2071 family)